MKTKKEILHGIIDILFEDDSPGQLIASQAKIIKQQKEEIEWLKSEMSKADMGHSEMADKIQKQAEEIVKLNEAFAETFISAGDFSIIATPDGYIIMNEKDKFDGKHVSPADVSKKLRELYYRTEEKRSCENCKFSETEKDTTCPTPEPCGASYKYDQWQPKQSHPNVIEGVDGKVALI